MTDVQPQEAARRKVVNRLRRAQGQLAAVTAAVERGESCRDVVTQLAAVSKAIDRAGYVIIANSMRECVAGQGEIELTAEELEKLFLSLA
ncbi:metal-sensitive transcriptional regulator [Gulosibacter sp. GYB002]|uniref:metal-sensitive transcriptional regulator n=1 Tax=Gulosibacter sp. GYB002 TaxID=2994391 RepID=UPI002F969A4C